MSFFNELWDAGAFRRNATPLTGGAIVFWLLTYFLSVAMKDEMGVVLAIVTVVWIAVLIALFTRVAHHFAVGFIAMVIAGSLATSGFLLAIWGLPAAAAYVGVDRATAPKTDASSLAAAQMLSRDAWVKARRAEPPVLAAGQILANTVNECAAAYREVDTLGSYPRNVEELEMVKCDALSTTRGDTTYSRLNKNDRGWRWTYTPDAVETSGIVRGYRVRVFEDPAIDRVAPQYITDGSAAVREFTTGAHPILAATPLAQLAQMRRCIDAVPTQRSNDSEVARKYTRYANPLDEVMHRCNDLRGVITVEHLNDPYGVITLTIRRATSAPVDTIGRYMVGLVPVDEKNFLFELSATPELDGRFHPGPRRYFVAQDGSVHARNGDTATRDDALVTP